MSTGRTLLMVLRWGIFLLACSFLYVRLFGPKGIVASGGLSSIATGELGWTVLVPVIGLMFLNWGIEAVKWRLLLRRVERLTVVRSFIAVIMGTSIGLITVNRTGEFLGRVLLLAPEHRVSGSFASSLGSIAQFVVTLLFGGLGLLVLAMGEGSLPWPAGWVSTMLATLTALITFIVLVLYLNPGLFRQLLMLIPLMHRFERASVILAQYERSDLLMVLVLSAARYGVFAFQYIMLLHALGAITPSVEQLASIGVIYLIATLIPSILLTELGVRGSVALAVLEPLGAGSAPVLLATSLLWLINVAAPACAGSVLLLFARIRTKREAS